MKIYILTLSIFLACTKYVAQRSYTLDDDKEYIDSLTKVIKLTGSDSIKCFNSFSLADLYRKSKDTLLSKNYLKKANAMAVNFPFLNDLAIYYNASNYYVNGDIISYEKQLVLLNEKLKNYPTEIAYTYRAIVIKNLSVVYQMQQDEKKAMHLLVNEGIPVAKKSKNHEMLGNLYKMIGIILMNIGEREKSNRYLELAIQSIEGVNENSYTFKESKLEAYIIHAENSIALNLFAKAKKSLDKAYKILKDYPNSNLNSIFYYAQGSYLYKLGQYKTSLISFDKSLQNCELNNDRQAANRAMFAKYKSFDSLKRYKEARDILIDLVENQNLFILETKKYCKEIIKICKKMNDVKNGYLYSLKYIQLSDSLYETDTEREIIELEAKYNTSEKEKKINQLKAQKQKALLTSEKNKFNYRFFGLLSVILLLILVFFWKNNITQKKLANAMRKNHLQNISSLKTQKEIEVMQAAISGEEEERKRIARDLHDGVGSSLSGLKMKLSDFKNSNTIKEAGNLDNFIILLNNSINELRQVSYNLIPETIIKLGLKHALQDLCYNLKTDEVFIEFRTNEISENIVERDKINIFRIIQELLNNALKHSNCSEIIVDCVQNESLFLITIEDNGIGFDASAVETFSGIGLKNLKNRVDLLNGKIDVDSKRSKGTSFNIELFVKLT